MTQSLNQAMQTRLEKGNELKDLVLTTDTSAYADGDVLAATQEIPDVFVDNAGEAILQSVVVLDHDNQAGALDLVFMSSGMNIGVENAAACITGNILRHVCGVLEVVDTNYVDMGGTQMATFGFNDTGFMVSGGPGSRSLHVAAISRDTKTYSATGLELKIGFCDRS
jgi:hypothetical protein